MTRVTSANCMIAAMSASPMARTARCIGCFRCKSNTTAPVTATAASTCPTTR